jgi:hypothetical protein
MCSVQCLSAVQYRQTGPSLPAVCVGLCPCHPLWVHCVVLVAEMDCVGCRA